MNDKYTFRDFLVYFMSGVIGSFLLLILFWEGVYELLNSNRDLLKDADTIIILLAIPMFYFFGHIVHGVDILLFYIGRPIRELNNKSNVFYPLNMVINGHRVSNVLYQKKIEYSDFSKNCAKLRNKKMFSAAEYWYVLNDFFKGIYVVSWIAIIICLYKAEYWIAFIYLILNLLYWVKARMYAQQYVNTVNNTIAVCE